MTNGAKFRIQANNQLSHLFWVTLKIIKIYILKHFNLENASVLHMYTD